MSQYATIQNNLIATHHILICKAKTIVQSKNAVPHCTYKCDKVMSSMRFYTTNVIKLAFVWCAFYTTNVTKLVFVQFMSLNLQLNNTEQLQ